MIADSPAANASANGLGASAIFLVPGQLGREDVALFHHGSAGEQVRCLRLQRFSHAPGEMHLPTGLVGESVEDGERRISDAHAEPRGRARFVLDER